MGNCGFSRPKNDLSLNISLNILSLALSLSVGAGGGLLSNFEQLVRGIWKPETNELLKMT